MGRNPKVAIEKEISKQNPDKFEARVKSTPLYATQNFIPPATLTPKELECWNWLVSIFRDTINCMVSDADVQLMELYCRARVASDEADAAIKKDNRYYIIVPMGTDKNGESKTTAKVNPNYKIRNDNAMLCLKYFDQLGLSPVARARIGVKAANAKMEENMFAALMNRKDE